MYEVGLSSQCVKVNSRKCGQICTGVGLLKTRGTSNKGELSTKQELGLIELLRCRLRRNAFGCLHKYCLLFKVAK